MRKLLVLVLPLLLFASCKENHDIGEPADDRLAELYTPNKAFGYVLDDFNIVHDTIRRGDTFGDILGSNGVPYDKIMEVATKYKDSFDVRRIRIGNPYILLNSKDSINKTQVFIYQNSKVDFSVVDFRDTVALKKYSKPVTYVEKEASGIINHSLSVTLDEQNLSPYMTDKLANIFAWTINFFRLQQGDRFKVVYTEKVIDDTISAGLHEIKAAYFEHHGKPLYAFRFDAEDSNENSLVGYFDENANNLRRAFLQAPVKFSRISSRYNLNRRIAYYGYQLRPHRGTDFAAPVGTPILATADGVVSKSEYRGGNGNYVKIRHNSTYETQYLHMKARNVKVGEYVRQGEVIGWIGMTGNTSGPHVCYRFWKNGKEVDPFKEEIPYAEPLSEDLHEPFFAMQTKLKEKLDCIAF